MSAAGIGEFAGLVAQWQQTNRLLTQMLAQLSFPSVQVPVVVSALPPATVAGQRLFVSDSTVAAATNFGAIVAGTGTHTVPVFSDGTNWRIG